VGVAPWTANTLPPAATAIGQVAVAFVLTQKNGATSSTSFWSPDLVRWQQLPQTLPNWNSNEAVALVPFGGQIWLQGLTYNVHCLYDVKFSWSVILACPCPLCARLCRAVVLFRARRLRLGRVTSS
jgi:hypothetical protein